MKHTSILAVLAAIALLTGSNAAADLEGLNAIEYVEGIRADALKVIAVYEDLDYFVAANFNGREYMIEGSEDYMTGDIVAAIFATCYTSTIEDDILLSVTYAGYIE